MEGTQPDCTAQRAERGRFVRVSIDVPAHLLDEFGIGVGLNIPLWLAAFTRTKPSALDPAASAEEHNVLGPRASRGARRTAINARGSDGVKENTVHGAVAPGHRVPV